MTTQLLCQTVIPTAGTDGALRTQLVGGPFKDKPGVVIETPH